MKNWSVGVLEYWSNGNNGMLEWWNNGEELNYEMECWSSERIEGNKVKAFPVILNFIF